MSLSAAIPPALQALGTRLLFTLHLSVDAPQTPGGPAGAERRVGNIPDGRFTGDRLAGTVLPGGGDWQTLRADGATLLDARILLRTDDNALIAMTYSGVRHGPPEVMARLGRGEEVDPAAYYFRIVASFATSAPRYEWLNRIVAVGTGHRLPAGPIYNLFEIL
jgi:hypothetical protein